MGNLRTAVRELGEWLAVGEKGEEGWDAERDSRAAKVAAWGGALRKARETAMAEFFEKAYKGTAGDRGGARAVGEGIVNSIAIIGRRGGKEADAGIRHVRGPEGEVQSGPEIAEPAAQFYEGVFAVADGEPKYDNTAAAAATEWLAWYMRRGWRAEVERTASRGRGAMTADDWAGWGEEVDDGVRIPTEEEREDYGNCASTPREVRHAINGFKTGTGSAPDSDLDTEMVVNGPPELDEALAHIVNMCLDGGIVAGSFVVGAFRALYKKGDIFDLLNYRLIVLLCVIGKVLDAVLLGRNRRVSRATPWQGVESGVMDGRMHTHLILDLFVLYPELEFSALDIRRCFLELHRKIYKIK